MATSWIFIKLDMVTHHEGYYYYYYYYYYYLFAYKALNTYVSKRCTTFKRQLQSD